MNTPEIKNIYRFMEQDPQLGERVYIDPTACVSGAVSLGDDVSIWPMTVARGDVNYISIGARSNIQDGSILHVTHEGPWQPDGLPLLIGEEVSVGHGAILHACTIGSRCLVGMGAIIMDGAVIEEDCIIGAGSLVTERTQIPPKSLVIGSPARVKRTLTTDEIARIRESASNYVRYAQHYLEEDQ